jgi:hypothetical protein
MSKKVAKVYTVRDIAVRYAKALKKGESLKDIRDSLEFITFGHTEHRSCKDASVITSIDYFLGGINCITLHNPNDETTAYITVTEVL